MRSNGEGGGRGLPPEEEAEGEEVFVSSITDGAWRLLLMETMPNISQGFVYTQNKQMKPGVKYHPGLWKHSAWQ